MHKQYNQIKENNGWEKINYGGNPTKNKDIKRAVFIGRYQPYHFGHIELINQKLKDNIPALVLIRDIEPDFNNPFTAEQSKAIIEKYHKHNNEDVVVMVIPDIESVNFGRGVGYEINNYIPTKEIANISATFIRDSIAEGNDEWKKYIPTVIQEDVTLHIK